MKLLSMLEEAWVVACVLRMCLVREGTFLRYYSNITKGAPYFIAKLFLIPAFYRMHNGVQPYSPITLAQEQSTVTTRLISPATVVPIGVSIVPFSLAVILDRTYQD